MKLEDLDEASPPSTVTYAKLLEKIEMIRSSVRWAQSMDRPELQKILTHCNTLRDEMMQLSYKERLVNFSASEKLPIVKESPSQKTGKKRKQELLERNFIFEGVFGESPVLLEALEIAEKAAPTTLPVLIDGESGTGKELMAKVIHNNSSRSGQPYVSINCGAIPENLIESELFGHKKGAFTGATSDRKGKFESADGGTIFLDEIGELPLQGQVKLLRVLQSNELQRVGSDQVTYVDARIVAATNRDLLEMSRKGLFREDLYYRLSVINVTLPPLRERRDEITLLREYFSAEAAEQLHVRPLLLSPRLQTFLQHYEYPGNIRELRNLIYRISCLAGGGVGDIEHLPDSIRPGNSKPGLSKKSHRPSLLEQPLADIKKEAADAVEKLYLEQGLTEEAGKVAKFARRVNMNRSHLWTLLKKHGLNADDYKQSTAGS